ncbi:Adaptor protein complex AP-3 delta subunit [Violaceomyces palustris]|uniref:Adaptor protein complex AP-3 delta subunit n=1 Tax=Violaceomyces palustris TaxID=1673888 RepID=A0ACD0NT54_9BASI|nr:Adaptor protein complex AP-3 delta subunit [Violaceomyces palustris]
MFERSLSALIKGLRSHRGKDEAKYVATVMDEIRHEVRSGDMQIKAEAVLKLTYLQMIGYPFSNASFHMLEIMASPRYHLKHVGYLAAAQCFDQDTDVLILATNMIKKDLVSSSHLDIAVALNGLSHIVTPDLARHLAPDIIAMLTHSRAAIRKKAVLVLYSVIIKCPEVLEQAWERLREKLEDPDLGVVSAAVNIICELARRDPKPFLPLSPQLFHLLTTSTNNWMLIKVIKLFGALTPLEPRLVRKLVPPITTIISTTPAMSLLYECIHTVIIGGMLIGPGGDQLATTCVEKLAHFLQDSDQNLKYISLLALVKILPTHPHLVAQHQDIVFESIEDPDLSIRLRALDLVCGMANRSNLQPIVSQLLSHLDPVSGSSGQELGGGGTNSAAAEALKRNLSSSSADASRAATAAVDSLNPTLSPAYRLEIVRRILSLGAYETYSNVRDFDWYMDVLVRLVEIANVPERADIWAKIRDQIIDVTSRVRAVRPYAVVKMIDLFTDQRLSGSGLRDLSQVLHAAAWVCGEYCIEVREPAKVIPLLLRPSLAEATSTTLAACIQNAVKLFAHWLAQLSECWQESYLEEVKQITGIVAEALDLFSNEDDTEVQERSVEFRQLFHLLQRDLESYKPESALIRPAGPEILKDNSTQKEAGRLDGESVEGQHGTSGAHAGETDEAKRLGPANGPKSLHLLSPLFFTHTLGPVGEKAQTKVPLPAGIELESWLVSPDTWQEVEAIRLETHPLLSSDPQDGLGTKLILEKPNKSSKISVSDREGALDEEERERRKRERLKRLKDDPFYIFDGGKKSKKGKRGGTKVTPKHDGADEVPVIRLGVEDLPGLSGSSKDKLSDPLKKSELGGKVVDPIELEMEEMPEQGESLSGNKGEKAKMKKKKVKKADSEKEVKRELSTSWPVEFSKTGRGPSVSLTANEEVGIAYGTEVDRANRGGETSLDGIQQGTEGFQGSQEDSVAMLKVIKKKKKKKVAEISLA